MRFRIVLVAIGRSEKGSQKPEDCRDIAGERLGLGPV